MNKYWFRKRQGLRSKDLGWGWAPISWEGWATIILTLFVILIAGYLLGVYSADISVFTGALFLLTCLVFILLAAFVSKAKTE